MGDFKNRRRQSLLDESVYRATAAFFKKDAEGRLEGNKNSPNAEALSANFELIAKDLWRVWQLRYTAGDDLSSLAQDLEEIVVNYEHYARVYENTPDAEYYDAFILDDVITPYVDYVNLLSAAILLHREDLIPRIYGLIEGGSYDGYDLVIEELLRFYVPGRPAIDEWLWEKPYRIALEALDEDTAAERERGMRAYVKAWYPSMKGRAAFWGKHTAISENNITGYSGYWTLEAAALSYLFEIDDSSYRDEVVYPKDLADYARSQPRRSPEAACATAQATASDPGRPALP